LISKLEDLDPKIGDDTKVKLVRDTKQFTLHDSKGLRLVATLGRKEKKNTC